MKRNMPRVIVEACGHTLLRLVCDTAAVQTILPPLAVPMDEEPSAAGGRRTLETDERTDYRVE
jgi:hypothetical protein